MGRKAKRKEADTADELKDEVYCYYCDREFDDEKVLILHQTAKHFKCQICNKKNATTSGLVIHCLQVHKEQLRAVPNCAEGKEDTKVEVYGMAGIPDDKKTEKHKEKIARKEAVEAATAASAAAVVQVSKSAYAPSTMNPQLYGGFQNPSAPYGGYPPPHTQQFGMPGPPGAPPGQFQPPPHAPTHGAPNGYPAPPIPGGAIPPPPPPMQKSSSTISAVSESYDNGNNNNEYNHDHNNDNGGNNGGDNGNNFATANAFNESEMFLADLDAQTKRSNEEKVQSEEIVVNVEIDRGPGVKSAPVVPVVEEVKSSGGNKGGLQYIWADDEFSMEERRAAQWARNRASKLYA